MALAYATSDRGGCHQRAFPIGSDALGSDRDPFETDGHAAVVVDEQNEGALSYSMVACDFTAYSYDRVVEWLNEFGYDVSVEDLETVGERAWNVVRLFNVREGFDREDDGLPERLKRPLESGGPADENRVTQAEFDEMLDEYYQLRGWNEDGIPTTTTTERLNIEPFVPPEVDLPE
jgi:aldehyde:ferredoxin oxidoreductase